MNNENHLTKIDEKDIFKKLIELYEHQEGLKITYKLTEKVVEK